MRAVMLVTLLALAGCSAPTTADGARPEVFQEKCQAIPNQNGGVDWVASHDFHTTDPATLARVVVFDSGPELIVGLDGGTIDGETERPVFQGSIAMVACNGNDALLMRYFILEP